MRVCGPFLAAPRQEIRPLPDSRWGVQMPQTPQMTTPAQAPPDIDPRAWLAEQLRDGPRPAAEIQGAADAAGLTARQLRTARESLCARPVQRAGGWWWRLK